MRDEIVNGLISNGYFEKDSFFDDDEIKISLEIERKQEGKGYSYCDIRHRGVECDISNAFSIKKIQFLMDDLKCISEMDTGRQIDASERLIVTRSLIGVGGNKESNNFHYDSFYLTALIGIRTPKQHGANGGLILVKKLRDKHTGPILNIIHKIMIQNRISKKVINFLVGMNIIKKRIIDVEEGKLIVFYGSRTLHASEKYPGGNRITLLIHVGLPNGKYNNFNSSELKLKIKTKLKHNL